MRTDRDARCSSAINFCIQIAREVGSTAVTRSATRCSAGARPGSSARLQSVARGVRRIVAIALQHVLDVGGIARQRRQILDQPRAIFRDQPVILLRAPGTSASSRPRDRCPRESDAAGRLRQHVAQLLGDRSVRRCAARTRPAKEKSSRMRSARPEAHRRCVPQSPRQHARRQAGSAQTRDTSPPRRRGASRASTPRWDARIPSQSKSSAASTARAPPARRARCARRTSKISKYCPA